MLVKCPITGGAPPIEKCHQQCYTFGELLEHYRQHHGLKLVSGLDYCDGCHVLFYDKFHGLLHYLHHVTVLIDQDISNEPDSTLKHNKNCQSCPFHFQEVQKMVNHCSLAVNFGEDDGMEEENTLLDYLEQQYADEVESADLTTEK